MLLVWCNGSNPTEAPTAIAGMDITVDASGNVVTTGLYMAGTTISATFGANTYFGTSEVPSIHVYVMKLNPSTGAITWIQKSNSISTCCQTVSSIGTDAANNVYIAGTMYSSTVSFGATSVTPVAWGHFVLLHQVQCIGHTAAGAVPHRLVT
jgi:hypothetical protein